MDIALFCVFGFYSMCIFALTISFMLDEFKVGYIDMENKILYPGYPNHLIRIDAWLHIISMVVTIVVFLVFFSSAFPIFWIILTCANFTIHILENLHSSSYRSRFLFMSEFVLLTAYVDTLLSFELF